jgi:uncharacterized protein YgiM (DUF1202 family)
MIQFEFRVAARMLVVLIALASFACKKNDEKISQPKDLPDLNEQAQPYVTTENTKVRTGPGQQFRAIAEIGRDAKVTLVGKDGDWGLIVSKKGNAPGFIELAAVRPAAAGDAKETLNPQLDGKYEALANTQVRSGPGLHYPVVADIAKGTKLNVVEENNGWLKVESKRGNKPGYVDANMAKPVSAQ